MLRIMLMMLALLVPANVSAKSLLDVSAPYIGLSEKSDRKKLQTLIGVNPRVTKWCGAWMCFVAKKAGRTCPKNPNKAWSWASWGTAVPKAKAKPGMVAVMKSHVGVIEKVERGWFYLRGGNQSNSVKTSRYRASRIQAVRK